MNIQTITKLLIDAGIEPNEAKIEIKMLLEHFCGYTELDRAKGAVLGEGQLEILKDKVLERIKDRTPIQYITGEAYFMGEFYKVTEDVLIPRDETEILVREAIDIIKKEGLKNVLDIGTGSGCIACAIAKATDAVVLGVDISSDALRVALDNVTKLGINNRAVFRKSDLFEKIREEEKFDVIISNPPYIPIGTEVPPEVGHEPKIALFAEENGLRFYREITQHAPEYLTPGGFLLFEIGLGEADAVRKFMSDEFTDIRVIKDMAGIERVVSGRYKKQR